MKKILILILLTTFFCKKTELTEDEILGRIFVNSALLRSITPPKNCSFKQIGGSSDDGVWSGIATDSELIFTGFITKNSLTNNSSSTGISAFVYKTNSSLTPTFTQKIGDSNTDISYQIGMDKSKNIYLAGQTSGSFYSNTHSGGTDILLYSLDANGNRRFASQFGTSSNESANDLKIDIDDNLFVVGGTNGNLDTQSNSGLRDGFITRLNTNGNRLWTRLLGTSLNDSLISLAIYNNSIYVLGATEGGISGHTNIGGIDIFVSRFDYNGNLIWTRQFGSTGEDTGLKILINSNKIYILGGITGRFQNTNSIGSMDTFFAELDINGNLLKFNRIGGDKRDYGIDFVFDSNQFIYILSNTESTSFDSIKTISSSDIALTKLDSNGTKLWSNVFGSAGFDQGFSLLLGKNNILTLMGQTNGSFAGQSNRGRFDGFLFNTDLNGNCF
jgi:hypothetical protein